jgi:hypothetical protein
MKLSVVILAVAVLVMPLLTSCSTLRTGNPLKAGYAPEEEGWLSRNVPGIRKLSEVIPPPSEARQKWDEQGKQRNHPWSRDGGL